MPDLRLLGPVELRGGDDRRYSLGPPRQRCVMAVLAMTPGRLVPVETLIARVWRDEPTNDMRDAVCTYVSRLRRPLRQAAEGSTPAPEIRRDNGGYVLTPDDANADLHRARSLVRQARQKQTGDPVRSAELLGEAAALWRGTPLAGLRGLWAEQMRRSSSSPPTWLPARRTPSPACSSAPATTRPPHPSLALFNPATAWRNVRPRSIPARHARTGRRDS